MAAFDHLGKLVYAVGRTRPDGVQLLGTAFLLNKPGYFATAAHVAGGDESGLVIAFKSVFHGNNASIHEYQDTSNNEIQMMPARIFATDPFHDLAVIKTDCDLTANNMACCGTEGVQVGSGVSIFGFPHADHGRMILTYQETEVGARVLIAAGKIKSKHLILNIQSRPGQSGSPVLRRQDGALVGMLVGSYAPGGGGGISLGGVDPHTLHQTTHAVSAEYLMKMY